MDPNADLKRHNLVSEHLSRDWLVQALGDVGSEVNSAYESFLRGSHLSVGVPPDGTLQRVDARFWEFFADEYLLRNLANRWPEGALELAYPRSVTREIDGIYSNAMEIMQGLSTYITGIEGSLGVTPAHERIAKKMNSKEAKQVAASLTGNLKAIEPSLSSLGRYFNEKTLSGDPFQNECDAFCRDHLLPRMIELHTALQADTAVLPVIPKWSLGVGGPKDGEVFGEVTGVKGVGARSPDGKRTGEPTNLAAWKAKRGKGIDDEPGKS